MLPPAKPPSASTPACSLAGRIKQRALRLGFTSVGILPAGPALTHAFYRDWLAAGHAGEMDYLKRHEPLKEDVRRVHPGALSIVAVTLNYRSDGAAVDAVLADSALAGRIARYAWGRDYHDVLREMLERLAQAVEDEAGRPVAWRAAVDSAPLMERELAARSGLGWVGKNANLIHWEHGSWLFLGELLLELELDYDSPRAAREGPDAPLLAREEQAAASAPRRPDLAGPDPARTRPALLESCGSCTACLDACPTGAIVADKTVDSRRCISYLTIELKGPIPAELRPAIGDWVFGCDICQDVCPWNRHAPAGAETVPGAALAPGTGQARPSLTRLLAMDDGEFRERFGQTAIRRTRRGGLLRNAAIALGNQLAAAAQEAAPHPVRREGLAALALALHDPEPVVRGAAAWALGQAGNGEQQACLDHALGLETDPAVRAELTQALQHCRWEHRRLEH